MLKEENARLFEKRHMEEEKTGELLYEIECFRTARVDVRQSVVTFLEKTE
jgi:hypothetical protein